MHRQRKGNNFFFTAVQHKAVKLLYSLSFFSSMKVVLDIKKTVEQNAANYFEKAKKAKKKLKGAEATIAKTEAELSKLIKNQAIEEEKEKKARVSDRKKEWYEKFRWFISSEGFLVIGGRDATTNEIIIKKYTESDDIVFHTDLSGSPFIVIKTLGASVGEQTMNEAASFCATFSRAWKYGIESSKVFSIKPEQVSKEAKSGEYLTKGSFMIYGERKYFVPSIDLCVGINNGVIMSGPFEAVKKNCEKFVRLIQGEEKASSTAKHIQRLLGGSVDEIIRALPAGTFKVKIQ